MNYKTARNISNFSLLAYKNTSNLTAYFTKQLWI